jgi:hypothetical protein
VAIERKTVALTGEIRSLSVYSVNRITEICKYLKNLIRAVLIRDNDGAATLLCTAALRLQSQQPLRPMQRGHPE